MEEKNIENNDSQNVENEENLESESQENNSGDGDESIESYKQKNQSLYEQLQKAKGKVRDENGKWVKKPESTREEPKAKSNELDYGQKAFLYAHDLKIKGEKETELVKNFMKETGKNLEQVLDSKYFQAELNEMREIQKTSDATIKGKDSKGIKIDSIEYWASKDFKDVPKEFKAKVIEHKLEKDKNKNVFYNS